MAYRHIPLEALTINRANDRHGELENETAAIAWLFNNFEPHMKNLGKDIVSKGGIFEPPLVFPDGEKFIVYDGNRRVTCLKLLDKPRRAPTVELQEFFGEQRKKWSGDFPSAFQCQVETDRDRIDDILLRRHTGTQGGIGQTTWDDRMKSNFINRTGVGGALNVADEIEKRLSEAGMLPRKKIPRSNMNRLFSTEAFRNRAGFTAKNGKFELTHAEPMVLRALRRIAEDLANRHVVLGDIWDMDGKRAYLDDLDKDRMLPAVEHVLPRDYENSIRARPAPVVASPRRIDRPLRRTTLIPNLHFSIVWSGRLQRHRAIWDELQFHLNLADHPNAISVLFRVLTELSVANYIDQTKLTSVGSKDSLGRQVLRVAEHLHSQGKINQKYFELIQKFPQHDALLSADTLNRYVHSPNFAPSADHLTALWDWMAEFIVHCLNT